MQRTLTLAAAPTFLLMALLTITFGDTSMCAGAMHQPLSAMAQMYLLMTAFHTAPWLKLFQ